MSWFTFFVLAFAALILGGWAWRKLPKASPEQARARAAVRTSRLALALPALLMLLIIIFLWGYLFHWATHTSVFPRPLFEAGVRPTLAPGGNIPIIKWFFLDPASVPNVNDYFAKYLVWSIGPGLAITLLLMIAGLFLLTWWALPSVITEKFPLRGERVPPRWSTNAESLHLGACLSRGLDAMAIVTGLMWCAIFLVPTIFYNWSNVRPDSPTLAMMNALTGSIISRTAGLTASPAPLGLIVRYTSFALRIVL